jgi:tetratricopeptide (TPR) repeat protein
MYSCPACGLEAANGSAVCACGENLSALRRFDALADAWFNRGLQCAQQGKPAEALEWMAACATARPSDAACRRAMSKLWIQLGHLEEAERCLALAANSESDNQPLANTEQK